MSTSDFQAIKLHSQFINVGDMEGSGLPFANKNRVYVGELSLQAGLQEACEIIDCLVSAKNLVHSFENSFQG